MKNLTVRSRMETDSDISPTAQFSKRHIAALDGVRAIAVLMVIVSHFDFGQGPDRSSLFYFVLGKVAVWGRTGVDLFFILSGYLITGILLT
jgi:peptidoglycan/LPS O-acetylase OafA/YrhL